MEKYYFQIDTLNRNVNFFSFNNQINCNDYIDEKHKSTFSFDEIIIVFNDYINQGYNNDLKELTDNMNNLVTSGNTDNTIIEDLVLKLKEKFANNIFAKIFLNILYTNYTSSRYDLNHLGISKTMVDALTSRYINKAKKGIVEQYNKLMNAVNNLEMYINKNFTETPTYIFQSNTGYIIKSDNIKMTLYYSVNESFDTFVHIFLSSIFNCKLKIFTCTYCQKKFFNTYNSKYCSATECQKQKELEARKSSRDKRKLNPYKHIVDDFGNYSRQIKHTLKLKNTPTELIDKYTQEQKNCQNELKMEVEFYQDTGKKIDEQLYSLAEEKKNYMKHLAAQLDALKE